MLRSAEKTRSVVANSGGDGGSVGGGSSHGERRRRRGAYNRIDKKEVSNANGRATNRENLYVRK